MMSPEEPWQSFHEWTKRVCYRLNLTAATSAALEWCISVEEQLDGGGGDLHRLECHQHCWFRR
jgi:hypothetical protein